MPKLIWYGHDAFAVTSDTTRIYLDPWKLPPGLPLADIICISHEHYDHFSLDDIRPICSVNTLIFAPAICPVPSGLGKVHVVEAGKFFDTGVVQIEVVPAYNPNKKFHPKADGRVGYVLTIEGQKIYHAGDTDLIPEMSRVKADVTLLPVSGTYVMTAVEAVEAVKIIRPRLAIPMHYDSIVGSRQDAEYFVGHLPAGTEGRILEVDAETSV